MTIQPDSRILLQRPRLALLVLALLMTADGPAKCDTDPMEVVEHLRLIGEREQMCKVLEPLVTTSHQNDPIAHLYYAQCLRTHNRLDEAREHLRRVLELTNAWPAQEASRALTDMQPVSIQSSPTKGGRRGYIGLTLDKGVVQNVLADSPAQHMSIAKGDRLISANGISLLGLDDKKISAYMHGYIGTIIELVIERGGKRFACKITRGEALEQQGGLPTKIVAATPSSPPQTIRTSKESSAATKSSSDTVPTTNASIALPITFKHHTRESDAVRTDVLAALAVIPKPLVSDVAAAGVKIAITPTIPEALNNSGTDRPRGYIHGGGYDNCRALYSARENTIFIAERASRGNAPPQRNVWIASSILHEFGHALDHTRKISSSEDFAAAYKADCDKLTNTLHTRYYYFTQTEEAGPSELFAELFAHALSGKGRIAINDANMPAAFPRSFAIVQKLIN
jgi:hypothetical protein